MAFYGVEYKYEKHENFDTFLKAVGLPADKIATLLSQKTTFKVTQSGDSYTMTSTSSSGPKDTTFKSGVEFDDVIGEDNVPIKSTFTVAGNTITQVIKSDLGTATFKREFNGNDLIVTITSDKFSGEAKRFYKS